MSFTLTGVMEISDIPPDTTVILVTDYIHKKVDLRNQSFSSNILAIHCSDNNLTELNISTCSQLTELYCSRNNLTELDLTMCHELDYIWCNNNKLTELDLTRCCKLTELWCASNELIEINLSGCPSITEAWCSYNQLMRVNVNGCKNLRYMICEDGQFSLNELKINNDLNPIRKKIAVRKSIARMRKAWYERRRCVLCSVDSRPSGVVGEWDQGGICFQEARDSVCL